MCSYFYPMNETLTRELLDEVYSDPAYIDELDRREREDNANAIDELLGHTPMPSTQPQGHSRHDEDGDIRAMKELINGRHIRVV